MSSLAITLERPVTGRLPALDELKGLAIMLVVLYHAGGALGWSNYLHGDLGVDIFVIGSGIGLAIGTSYPGAADFFRRRLVRIVPAYWLALTAFLLLNTHFLQHKYSAANIVLHYLGIHGWFGDAYAMSINDSFWFITLILSFYLLYAVLRKLLASPEKLLLAGAVISAAAALAWFFTGQAGSFGHLGLRIPGFFFGLLIGQFLRTGCLNVTLGATSLGAAFILAYVPYTQGIVFHTGVVALVLMGTYALVVRPSVTSAGLGVIPRTLKFLGDHSLEIFLLHQPLIREYNFYLHGRWLNIPQPSQLSLAIGMLIGITITLVVSVELRRLLQRLLPQ